MQMNRKCAESIDQRRIRFFRDVTWRMPTLHSDSDNAPISTTDVLAMKSQ